MTLGSGSAQEIRWAGRGEAHGLAVLLLAVVLAAGTGLPQFGESGSAFPEPPGAELLGQSVPKARAVPPQAQPGKASSQRWAERGKSTPQFSGPLNINTANAESLQALPGIGPTLAERVVADRQAHGPFQSEEELLRVPGIGPKRFQRIRSLVQVPEGP
jgi:competence protein ComEA